MALGAADSQNVVDIISHTDFMFCRRGLSHQKKALRELKNMFDMTAYFDSDQISNMLMVVIRIYR